MAPEQLISSPLKEADKTGSLSPRTWSRPGRRAAGRGQARSGDPYATTRAGARGHRGEGQRVGVKFALRALAGSGEGRFPPGGNLGALRWSKEKKLPGEFMILAGVAGQGVGGGGGRSGRSWGGAGQPWPGRASGRRAGAPEGRPL